MYCSKEVVFVAQRIHNTFFLYNLQLVPPGGNTSFDIIFVGKDLVPLTTHYYIFTSKGIIKYDVSIVQLFISVIFVNYLTLLSIGNRRRDLRYMNFDSFNIGFFSYCLYRQYDYCVNLHAYVFYCSLPRI